MADKERYMVSCTAYVDCYVMATSKDDAQKVAEHNMWLEAKYRKHDDMEDVFFEPLKYESDRSYTDEEMKEKAKNMVLTDWETGLPIKNT